MDEKQSERVKRDLLRRSTWLKVASRGESEALVKSLYPDAKVEIKIALKVRVPCVPCS